VSGFVLTCWRATASRRYTADDLREVAYSIAPSNISPNTPVFHEHPGLALAILNPVTSVVKKGGCACLGMLLDSHEDWWKPALTSPDGSYAICRSNDGCVELVTDDFGSRPLWYVQTPDVFLASTSQRAIVRLLGDFSLNPRAVSWMLSSGCLGPEDSWDNRLRRVPPGTRLSLDRHTWDLTASRMAQVDESDAVPITETDQVRKMSEALSQTFEALDLSVPDWRLPLSGGKDSRCLLVYLRRAGHWPKCITWGMEQARLKEKSDAYIAARVAEAVGVEHEYFAVDRPREPRTHALGRYVATCEGLIDHVSAYVDGLDMWRELFESGVVGVMRGEIAMGWYVVKAPQQGRRSIVPSVADYSESSVIKRLALPDQTWPEHLLQQPGETAQQHADRLYFEIRLPRVLAPLNHLKCAYVEVAEPLLSRAVARVTRRILLTGRAIPVLRELTEHEGPQLPFATASALASVERCVRETAFAQEVKRELSSATAKKVLSDDALELLVRGMEARSSNRGLAWKVALHSASRLAPSLARRAGTRAMPVSVLPYELAFRAYIASRTVEMFTLDAQTVPVSRRRAGPAIP
jgi:hypothetical protein